MAERVLIKKEKKKFKVSNNRKSRELHNILYAGWFGIVLL